MVSRNVGTYLPNHMASLSRRIWAWFFNCRRFRLLGQRIQWTFFTSKKLLFLTMSEWCIPDLSVVQVPRPAVFLVCRLSLVLSCHQEPMEILFLGHSHLQSAMWIVTFTYAVLS